jgi:hypothetical protein
MIRFDSAIWRRRKAAAKAMLAHLRVDTPRNAFATIGSAAIGLIIAVLFPADGLGKIIAGVLGWMVVQSIMLFWIYRTLPEEPKPVIGFSPFYDPEYRKKFRAEQRAIQQQIDQHQVHLTAIIAEMAKVDLTTQPGQEQLKRLSPLKADAEQKLAALKGSVRNIGWTGD